jgi:hypothetical protein
MIQNLMKKMKNQRRVMMIALKILRVRVNLRKTRQKSSKRGGSSLSRKNLLPLKARNKSPKNRKFLQKKISHYRGRKARSKKRRKRRNKKNLRLLRSRNH